MIIKELVLEKKKSQQKERYQRNKQIKKTEHYHPIIAGIIYTRMILRFFKRNLWALELKCHNRASLRTFFGYAPESPINGM